MFVKRKRRVNLENKKLKQLLFTPHSDLRSPSLSQTTKQCGMSNSTHRIYRIYEINYNNNITLTSLPYGQ